MSLSTKNLQKIGAGVLACSTALAHATPPSAEDLVDALNGVFGKHAGARSSHAKGVCVAGHFTPDPQALKVTEGPLWHQGKVPVEARFSVGGGNPHASDKAKTVRGFSLRIDNQWDLVAISAPVFMVATPEEFVGFMAARRPDPATGKPNPTLVKRFNEATPSTAAQISYLEQAPVPGSYAQTAYWAVNAFVFTDAKGKQVHGRWRLEPLAGHVGLNETQLSQLDDNFLKPELAQRLGKGAVSFDLWLQLAQQGDDVKNPTVAWPPENPKVHMGTIEITSLENNCENTMFNPAMLPTGMAISEDPTLLVRAAAYAISLGRRLNP